MSVEQADDAEVLRAYGAHYWQPGQVGEYRAREQDLYDYICFIGQRDFVVERGSCAYVIDDAKNVAARVRGPAQVSSAHFAVLIRGYQPDDMTRRLDQSHTQLPYVNGCHTKQLFPPERPGDPTMQLLNIPPYSKEQAHHIHSTVRCVYVLRGLGKSIVGMEGKAVATDLVEGLVCVLDPMCPHHFETPQGQHIVVLPVHVWSSVGAIEQNHPMFNGTHMMNQGG